MSASTHHFSGVRDIYWMRLRHAMPDLLEGADVETAQRVLEKEPSNLAWNAVWWAAQYVAKKRKQRQAGIGASP